MLYIITALKPEAQAFVDKYKLQKSKLGDFTLFSNEYMMLSVSGLGVQNCAHATQNLINHFDITDDDIYLNIGICAGSDAYKIGELIKVDAVTYNSQTYKISETITQTLNCVNKELSEALYDLADMESFGFYDAVSHSPAIKNYYILKVISDHFEPKKVKKDATKSLIFNVIDAINSTLNKKVIF